MQVLLRDADGDRRRRRRRRGPSGAARQRRVHVAGGDRVALRHRLVRDGHRLRPESRTRHESQRDALSLCQNRHRRSNRRRQLQTARQQETSHQADKRVEWDTTDFVRQHEFLLGDFGHQRRHVLHHPGHFLRLHGTLRGGSKGRLEDAC